MTNQEAIEIINRENNPNDKEVWDTFPEYREALDMAIEALEQEPTIGQLFSCEEVEELRKKIWKQVEQESKKTGHWIMVDKELSRYKCSECGEIIKLYKKSEISSLTKDETLSDYPFSHCGAKMVEPQESEDKG